jgi:hypothetical protein
LPKKLTRPLAALAMLIWICPPAQADFKGLLQRDQAGVLSVDNSSTTGATAITVYYLSSRRQDIEIFRAPGGARIQFLFAAPGRGVGRVIIEVSPPIDQTIPVELLQNGISFFHTSVGDARLVFDVE